MEQNFMCKHCGQRSPTIFQCFLHIFTDHLKVNIGVSPTSSKQLLASCVEYDKGYYQLMYEILPKIPTWGTRN